ncbi:MAG TPA: class II aldolase/adducin family protein [Bryobacteraceae bacterium]|nr:class II aldolase/adducin family protein [Bryobacteraceae bacterium]
MPGESALREELVKACQVLFATGAGGDGLAGHLSARLEDGRMLIKPRPASWTSLATSDLIVLDFAGRRVDGPASELTEVREWPIHARVYQARPEVACVLHAHPAASTLMAALGIAVEPIDQDCAIFAGQLPVLDNCGVSISTPVLGDEVAQTLGKARALLLKNHGSVVTGGSVGEVCVTAYRLEKVAETMLRAASIASLPLISEERKAALLAARKAAQPARPESGGAERWRMLQDYYLRSSR